MKTPGLCFWRMKVEIVCILVKNAKLENYYLLTNKKLTDIRTGDLWLSFCTVHIQGKEWFNEIPFNIVIEISQEISGKAEAQKP